MDTGSVDGSPQSIEAAAAEDDNENIQLSTLHGLPRDVNIVQFAEHRARELATLTAFVEVTSGNKRVFQQLPRHMRRRAQSYNVKRVPRRIREAHRRELEKVTSSAKKPKDKKSKLASRRHRRTPRNLLLEYNRRQREFVWLETHIWHAKRFRMCQRWGYKLPMHPCDKSIRACYRGATRAALLQDQSYYCCIEISGDKRTILDGLKQLTSSKCGLTFDAVRHASGQSEGCVLLYCPNMYPHAAIGEAKFMWRPQTSMRSSNERLLWIWIHPACHEQVLSELINVFSLEITADSKSSEIEKQSALLKEKAFMKLEQKLGQFYEKMQIYLGRHNGIRVKSLKDTLVRLRLIGQMSTAILTDVLRVAFIETNSIDEECEDVWWKNPNKLEPMQHYRQTQFWKCVSKSPFSSQLPPNSIIGLTVHDPREANAPTRNLSKTFPIIPDSSQRESPTICLPDGISDSLLWEQDIRDQAIFSKLTDNEMNKLRSQHLVPGTPLELGDRGSRVPLILIQNPGNQTSTSVLESGMGWDVILPAGWAMPFWISFVYRNARVGGLREESAIAHQSSMLHFPEDFPDTMACRTLEAQQRDLMTTKYFMYPPDKRPNYIKLGVVAPFHSPWKILTNEWAKLTSDTESEGEFFVLREKSMLRRLQQAFHGNRKVKKCDPLTGSSDLNLFDDVLTVNTSNLRSIVGIRLKMLTRGIMSELALICMPNQEDLKELNKKSGFSGPIEPRHRDELKALRKRVKERRKSRPTKNDKKNTGADTLNSEMKEILKSSKIGKQEERRLWIPEVISVMKTCSRHVLGFAKHGSFSLGEGHVTGLAFVSLAGLMQLKKEQLNDSNPKVLVRQTNSEKYRFATFTIQM